VLLTGPSTIECHPPGNPDTATWRDSAADSATRAGEGSKGEEEEVAEEEEEEEVGPTADLRGGQGSSKQHEEPSPASQLQKCADICIWDQYPPLSVLHSAEFLPEKLEWFAFPNGPREKISRSRPMPDLSSFVLHSDAGEVEVSHCVCLTFYLRGERERERGNSGEDDVQKEAGIDWWRADIQDILTESNLDDSADLHEEEETKSDQKVENSPTYSWFGVCLCLMTRSPFVSELSAVLSSLYEAVIVDALLEREALATSTGASSSNDNTYTQLQLHLCHVLEPLCFDVPTPIPGYMDVDINFDFSSIVVEQQNELQMRNSFHFSLQDLDVFPQCAYSIEHCIHLIGTRTLLDLLYHAFSEHKILLYSHNPAVPPMICECLRTLLHPLKWSSVYIPTVPSLLLDLVDAPVPFILGISSSDLAYVDPSALAAAVCVDCDTGRMRVSEALAAPCCFSPALDRWCATAIKAAVEPDFHQRSHSHTQQEAQRSNNSGDFNCEKNTIIQAIIFDCVLSMLCFLPDCVYNVNSGFPQINVDKLLEGYCPSSAVSFVRALSSTQAFHRLVASIHRPEMNVFLQCAARLRGVFQEGEGESKGEGGLFSAGRGSSSRPLSAQEGFGRAVFTSQMFPLEQSRFYDEDEDDGDDKEKEKAKEKNPRRRQRQRGKSMLQQMTPPYFNLKKAEGGAAVARGRAATVDRLSGSSGMLEGSGSGGGGGDGGGECESVEAVESDVFPPWITGVSSGGNEVNNIHKCVFQVMCRYQEVLGCFSGFSPLFTPARARATFTVDIDCNAQCVSVSAGEEDCTPQQEEATHVAIFPPLCFAEVFPSDRQRYLLHWKLDELMRKLKKQHAALTLQAPLGSDASQGWKRLFRLLTTCKVNQKLCQHQRGAALKGVETAARSSEEEARSQALPLSPPASPNDHTVKRLHHEFMFGSDNITRLVLQILPVRHSDLNLDEELVAKLQFQSREVSGGLEAGAETGAETGDLFAQGDARRRVVRALKGYAKQLVITFIPTLKYRQQYQEANKKHMTLPSKRLKNMVEKFPVELHVIAFGYLHQLFKLLLQACAKHNDYLTAYGALEMSGYYYQVHYSDADKPNCFSLPSSTPDRPSRGAVKSPVANKVPSVSVSGILKHSQHGLKPPLSPAPRGSTSTPERRRGRQGQGQGQSRGQGGKGGQSGGEGGVLVQSLRSRICHDPLFGNTNLWQTVMNDTMSAQYVPQEKQSSERILTGGGDKASSVQEKEIRLSVYNILKPVLIHMMECNISMLKINELLENVMLNFDIQDSSEKSELMDRFNLLWQVGRESIRKASGDIVGSDDFSDRDIEEKMLLIRRVLHSTTAAAHLADIISTPKHSSDSPVTSTRGRRASRSFDFSSSSLGRRSSSLSPPPPPHPPPLPPPPSLTLGPQISTISMNPFDNDALFVTDDDEDVRLHRDSLVDSEYLTDTDVPPTGRVRFAFAGQPRHESSLGSHTKQLTSMHSACVTSVDIAQSQYNYVLHSHHTHVREANTPAAPTLALSHHLISGDAEGHVYVTNWSSFTTRNSLLGKQKHPAPVLAVRGLPNDYIASACSGGELKIWNIVPEGKTSSTRKPMLVTHKPFSGTRGGRLGTGISSLMLADSSSSGTVSAPLGTDMTAPELIDRSSWLLAVGGTRGGLKVYHGDSHHSHLAGGVEVLSVQDPDRSSSISCIHLAGSLSHKVGGSGSGSGSTFSGQLPTSSSSGGTSAVQSFNNLLKHSVHSRIQALLSTPAPRDKEKEEEGGSSSGYLFSGSSKGGVSIFDLASSSSSEESCVFRSPPESSHTALVSGVVPVPYSGGKHVVSGGYDRLVKFWDARASGRDCCCLDLVGAGGAVTHVAMDDSNPHRILGVSSDNIVRLWDTRLLQSGEPYMSFHTGHTDRICDVMQLEGMLLTASRDGTIISWNMNTGQCVQTLTCHTSSVIDGYASLANPGAKSGHMHAYASLACTRLLRTPLLRPVAADTSDDSSCGGDSGGKDSMTASRYPGADCFSSVGRRRKKERAAVAMLVTGDYGGTVKVWRGTAGGGL
jgi:hypothetical protein